MRMLVIGAPGCGKGTQGVRLAKAYGVAHIAAGDLLRAEIAAATELGSKVTALVGKGELVPDQLVLDLVMPKVMAAAAAGGFILDGFPRSAGQALAARRITEENDAAVQVAVNIVVPREALVDRLLKRAEIEGRADDTIEIITNRLNVFDKAIEPLLTFYRDRKLLVAVDGSKAPDEVTAAIMESAGWPAGQSDESHSELGAST